jgi:F-type H+-transporting ATPase subunit alpha
VSKAQLERGYRLVELLKQGLNSPMPVEEQVVSLFAGTKGYLDDIPVADVRRFEAELLEYVRARHGAVLAELRTNAKADVPADMGDIVSAFKAQFKSSVAKSASVDPTATSADALGEAASNKTLATE